MNIRSILMWLLFAVSIAVGYFVQPHITYPAVIHWGIDGTPNGFAMPFWAVAFGPLMIGFITLLWWVIPKIDPLRKNIESMRAIYDWMWLAINVFLFYVYALTLYYNTGHVFDFNVAFLPALALMFIVIGVIFPHLKRNWFMGIRTPWTLENDTVWHKTHILGGKLFIAAGILMFGGLLYPAALAWFFLAPLLVATIIPIIYSYMLHRKHG